MERTSTADCSLKDDSITRNAVYQGRWYGDEYYAGLHYDLHAREDDTELGTRCHPADLAERLRLMAPHFVQTDCKGHPGYTSWFSRTPEASVPPGLKADALKQWREATTRLGLPLHCHYSGIWDKAAAAKHADWTVVPAAGTDPQAPMEKMCPRGPYLEKLMIPQLLELIDRYQVDGFWVDGDMWAVEPCYCPRCRQAFTERTGIEEPPVSVEDPNWSAWWNFTRESFEEYVTRYCDAVHAHNPGVLVCSNWLQTFRHPGEPSVPTDWISGDNTPVFGLNGTRCEARFLSTRGKPWDLMLWSFYRSRAGDPASPWTAKPPEMLIQEAATVLAFGGNIQVYEHPQGLRDGRLIPWRMRRLGKVVDFAEERRDLFQSTQTYPQIAVLHSEQHARNTVRGKNLMHDVDVAPVEGAVFSLLESLFAVDVLDEWALLPRLQEFPVVVAPEQDRMSAGMVAALKEYVLAGGRLLVSGAAAAERFGPGFLGVTAGTIVEKQTYYVPAADGAVPLYSDRWRLVEPTTAEPLGPVGKTPLRTEELFSHPAAVVQRHGSGKVVFVPAAVFRDFRRNRYPLTRKFVGQLMNRLAGRRLIRGRGPSFVDLVCRRKGNRLLIHLLNRANGVPSDPGNGAVVDIPAARRLTLEIPLPHAPRSVWGRYVDVETLELFHHRRCYVFVHDLHVHGAVVVELPASD